MTSGRINLWLLILATAIACQAGGVSIAHASCGDYLSGHHHSHARSRVSETSFLPEQDEWPGSTLRPFRQTPCHGLDCQKGPAEPLAPTPTKITTTDLERLGCLNAELPPLIERESCGWIAQDETLSPGHPLSIEHPPRA